MKLKPIFVIILIVLNISIFAQEVEVKKVVFPENY